MRLHYVFAILIITILISVLGCSSQVTPVSQSSQAASTAPTTPIASTPTNDTSTITALTQKPSKKTVEAELKYDDGNVDEFLAAGGGYLIDFKTPGDPFTINKIKIMGGLFGSGYEGKDFRLEIWDANQKSLYSETYPVSKFVLGPNKHWVEFDIPDVICNGQFYIHVFTNSGRMQGLHLGADNSIKNEHSEHTVLTATDSFKLRTDWPYPSSMWFGDKSKVNWMIHVIGTY